MAPEQQAETFACVTRAFIPVSDFYGAYGEGPRTFTTTSLEMQEKGRRVQDLAAKTLASNVASEPKLHMGWQERPICIASVY
jgi:hypothetical protein